MKKITLFLMTEKGYTALSHILSQNFNRLVEYEVVTREDPNVIEDFSSQIRKLCNTHSVKVLDWNAYKVCASNSDYMFAVGWRWLITNHDNKLIVFHDSLLPKYRGFSPLVNSLINGEREIGVTALFAADDYDTGDIIAQRAKSISYPLKIHEAIQLISPIYAEMIVELIKLIIDNRSLLTSKQDENMATYSLWRDSEDYIIDWTLDSHTIKRTVDALGFPFLGAQTYLNEKLIYLLEVEVLDDVKVENRLAGKVIYYRDKFPVVVCGSGLLKIKSMLDIDRKPFTLKTVRSRFK